MLVIKNLRAKIAVKKRNVSVVNKIYQTLNNEYKKKYKPSKKHQKIQCKKKSS